MNILSTITFLTLTAFFCSTGSANAATDGPNEKPIASNLGRDHVTPIDAQGQDVGKYYFWHDGWQQYGPLDPPETTSDTVSKLEQTEKETLRETCFNRQRFCKDYYYGSETQNLVLSCTDDDDLQEFLNRKSFTYSVANEVGNGTYQTVSEGASRAYKAARNAFTWIVYQSGGWAVHAYNWSSEQLSNLTSKSPGQIYEDSKSAAYSAAEYVSSLAHLAEAYVINNTLRKFAEAKGRRIPFAEERLWVDTKARLYCLSSGENTRDLAFLGASLYGGRYLLKKSFGAADALRKVRKSKSGVEVKANSAAKIEKGAIKWLAKDALFSKMGPLTGFLKFYKSAARYWRRGKDVVNSEKNGGLLNTITGGFARVKESGKIKIYGDKIAATGKAYGTVFATDQAIRGTLRQPTPQDIEEVTQWLNQVREDVEAENGDLQNQVIQTEEDQAEFENLMP